MFLKSDSTRTRPARPARRWSLAARLTIWYAASAFGLLLTVTLVLYWGLSQGLNEEDDQLLKERIRVVEGLLRQAEEGAPELKWEVESEWEGFDRPQVFVRILRDSGSIAMESPGMSGLLPQGLFSPPVELTLADKGTTVHASDKKPFRVMTATVQSPQREGPFQIHVAVDQTSDEAILGRYRTVLAVVLVLAAGGSLGFGYRIARSGMRPVEEMVAATQRIRTSTLSERVQLENSPAELAALEDNFNSMLTRLEDSFERLSRFSADIAHELRTPLSNLRGETEVALSKERSAAEYREVLASNLEECEALAKIIDSLLFIARADSPAARVDKQRVDLAEELRKVAEFYELAAAEKQVCLTVDAPAGIEGWVDATLFQRAVSNLISNAIFSTPKDGSVQVTAAQKGSAVNVVVSDSGRGIPVEHQQQLFDRFYRVDWHRSRDSGGAGLGLSIVQSVMRLHGGSASIKSHPGHGTRVTLTFPHMTKT